VEDADDVTEGTRSGDFSRRITGDCRVLLDAWTSRTSETPVEMSYLTVTEEGTHVIIPRDTILGPAELAPKAKITLPMEMRSHPGSQPCVMRIVEIANARIERIEEKVGIHDGLMEGERRFAAQQLSEQQEITGMTLGVLEQKWDSNVSNVRKHAKEFVSKKLIILVGGRPMSPDEINKMKCTWEAHPYKFDYLIEDITTHIKVVEFNEEAKKRIETELSNPNTIHGLYCHECPGIRMVAGGADVRLLTKK